MQARSVQLKTELMAIAEARKKATEQESSGALKEMGKLSQDLETLRRTRETASPTRQAPQPKKGRKQPPAQQRAGGLKLSAGGYCAPFSPDPVGQRREKNPRAMSPLAAAKAAGVVALPGVTVGELPTASSPELP